MIQRASLAGVVAFGLVVLQLAVGALAADAPPTTPEGAPAAPAEPTAAALPPAPTPPAAPADTAAVAVVDRLHERLLEVMKQADSLGYSGRFDRLAPVLRDLFDFPFMAEKSVGRFWKDASPDERTRLIDTFGRYTIASYAGRFNGFSGQRFETLGIEDSTRGTRLVRTRLELPGDDPVALDYRMRAEKGGWRIIDVYLNGTVSELALRRSEYSSLIKREGFQALLEALDHRIEELATSPPTTASSR